MLRHLSDIDPKSTSHGVGMKRVLLSSNESNCSITQIAVTELKQGEVAVAHIHPDMQEGFYVLDGELDVRLHAMSDADNPFDEHGGLVEKEDEILHCCKDDFVYVNHGTLHELRALTDVRVMTIGCVIEAKRKKLYPIVFKPNPKKLVWGTEEWTVSTVPGNESEIENGTWARYKLSEVISQLPEAILGRSVYAKYQKEYKSFISPHPSHNVADEQCYLHTIGLPLLTKIIDAHDDLSIQVHPNDDMARREHGKLGKSEMWYILDAEPGACLYAGFKEHINPDEFKRLIAESQKGQSDITSVLARHEVHKGDVFYLPAGRVHAICGGIKLAEVQQSSDVTYRIYDYNRPGLDGKPRELHTELAAQAIDYDVYPEYRTLHHEQKDSLDRVLDTPYFSVRVLDVSEPFHRNLLKYDSFVIVMCFEGDCHIHVRSSNDDVLLPEGQSCLIPAAIADYDIIPAHGSTKVLETFINNRKSIGKLVSDFFHMQ